MTVTVAVQFPLGRYHATPWDRSANEGAVEWPPSPWRLLRTLVATWYTRWPELPAPVLDQLLAALGEPPAYWTPPVEPSHTRHYLPGAGHRKGEVGGTELTLDPYLSIVDQDRPLLVQWPAELTAEQRETLGKLVELAPYLGRSESVCDMRLLAPAEAPQPDDTWWRPQSAGTETARLLAAALPVRRALLELSTVDLRKQRRTMPPDSRWVVYGRTRPEPAADRPPQPGGASVTAVRFAVQSRAPLRLENGILLADELHRIVTRILDGGSSQLLGHQGAATDHQHAHWVPLPEDNPVKSILVWAPVGFNPGDIAAVLSDPKRLQGISGRRGSNGYEVKGLPPVDLLLQAAGPVRTVAPELCGRAARRWRSLTPYLPVRHHKPNRETLEEYLATDVRTELGYRGIGTPVTVTRDPSRPDAWALGFRRYRMKEHLGKARRGYGLRLEFETEVDGPLLLGQLSHFGYGIFVPAE